MATKVIRDVMPKRSLVTVKRSDPVTMAAEMMRDQDIGDVLVMDGKKLCGIVTDRDIVVRTIATGLDPATTPVGDICSTSLATLTPDDEVDDAVNLMRKKAIRRIPILDGGTPVGVISIGDLALQRDPGSALGGISRAAPNS